MIPQEALGYHTIVREDVAEWLRIADHDIRAAASLLKDRLWPGAAYFCQQAAEKLLKALALERMMEPPRTHDLVELAELVGLELSAEQKMLLTRLSDHAARSRYPGAEYKEEEVRQLFEETKRFFEWLRARLS